MFKTHTITIELIPDINSLKSQLMNIPLNPNELLVLPTFGSLPDPLYGSINIPDLEIQKFVTDLVNQQLFTNILNLVKPLLSFLQLDFSIFPKIPVLDVGLDQLLTMDSKALEEKIVSAIESGITIPYIDNVYRSLEMAELAASQILARIKAFYAFDCIKIITDLITSALDKLNLNITFVLPLLILPNFAELETAFREILNSVIDLDGMVDDLVDGVVGDIGARFAAKFAEYSKELKVIFDTLNSVVDVASIISDIGINLGAEFEWHQFVTELMSYITGALLKKIMDFCESVLGMLGFSFYKIKIPILVAMDYNFPVINIDDPFKLPEININDLVKLPTINIDDFKFPVVSISDPFKLPEISSIDDLFKLPKINIDDHFKFPVVSISDPFK